MSAKNILLASVAAVLLVACRGFEQPTSTETAAPSSTLTNANPGATAQPTSSAAEEGAKDPPQATPAGSACLSDGGQVRLFELDSQFMPGALRVRVYTPPCYDEQPQRSFPVLYLFHGQTYNDDQWDRLGADEVADTLIGAGELEPFLIVMPYYPSSNQPSANPFEDAFLQELLPWVSDYYRVPDEREYRAVGGLSMGASWALHFGVLHPEKFGAMAGHSPPVFVEDASQVRGWLAEIPADMLPRIWLDIGDRDQAAIRASAEWFEGVLTEMDIPHEWHLFVGRHEEAYWEELVELYLRWYAAEW